MRSNADAREEGEEGEEEEEEEKIVVLVEGGRMGGLDSPQVHGT